jgi:hypothetical protein
VILKILKIGVPKVFAPNSQSFIVSIPFEVNFPMGFQSVTQHVPKTQKKKCKLTTFYD